MCSSGEHVHACIYGRVHVRHCVVASVCSFSVSGKLPCEYLVDVCVLSFLSGELVCLCESVCE